MDNGRQRQRMMINLLMIRVRVYQEVFRRRALRAPQPQPQLAAPQRARTQRRANILRNRLSPLGLTSQQILTTYRLDMPTILIILGEIEEDITPMSSLCTAVPPLLKLLCVLHFCATGSFQHSSGMLHGIAQPTFSVILSQVMAAMLKRVRNHVYMPRTPEEINATKAGLYTIAHFPNVLGCIDCTHIALVPPREHEQAYRNRKMSHTMNVQMVCDVDLCILQICARFPGSAHDARILRESRLFTYMEQRAPPQTVLLGDSGYPLMPWLMTPYRNPQTVAQENFNRAHISTRNCIERAFGVLKARFRCLDRTGGALIYKPEKVSSIVVLCTMLHNIAIRRRVPLPDVQPYGGEDNDSNQQAVPLEGMVGRAVRDTIATNFFAPP